MKEDGSTSLSFAGTTPCKMEDGDIWGDDVLPSENLQDNDPKFGKASSAGRRTGRKSKATGGIHASPCKAQTRTPSASGTSTTSAQTNKGSSARSVSPRSTSKKIYPSVQARLLIQLEHFEGEAKAVYDSIMRSTDGFQYADPQKIALPKAGTDEVQDLGFRGKKVFANSTSNAESLELLRSAVGAYLAKDVADLQASLSYLLRILKECELAGLMLPRVVLAEVVNKQILSLHNEGSIATAISAWNSAALVECGIQLFLGHDEITALRVTVGTNLLTALLNDMDVRDLVHHLGSLADVMLSTDAQSALGSVCCRC